MTASRPPVGHRGSDAWPPTVPAQTVVGVCDAAAAAAAAAVARLAGQIVPRTWTHHLSIPGHGIEDWISASTSGHAAVAYSLRGDMPAKLLIGLPVEAAEVVAAATLRLPPGAPLPARLGEMTRREILGAAAASYLRSLTSSRGVDFDTARVSLARVGVAHGGAPLDVFLSASAAPQLLRIALVIEHPRVEPLAIRFLAATH